MILSSIKTGLAQVWKSKRMVLIFFLANLSFALVLMLPFRAAVSNFAGETLMGTKLAGHLPIDFIFELMKNNKSLFSIYGTLFMLVPASYWLLSLFLSGGAFATFARGDGYSSPAFWAGAATYFGRFNRLFLWSLPVFAVLLCLQFLETGFQRLIFGSDPYEYVKYWGGWVKYGLRVISFVLCAMVYDYARIHVVTTGETRMRVSLWHGIRTVFGNLGRTFALAFGLFLCGALVLAIYNPIADSLAAPNAFVVLTLFVLQQAYMLFRMLLRLTLYSSQLFLSNKLAGAPAPLEISTDPQGLEGAAA